MNSVANAIAPSLKYCPNEKLPSISKNVRWKVSRPTSSMWGVRKTFCTRRRRRRRRRLAAEEERHLRLHAGGGQQRRAVVGPRHERRRRAAEMPFYSKYERNPSRISAVVRTTPSCRYGSSGPGRMLDRVRSRRKRHRYRLRPVGWSVGVLVLAAVVAGAWVGARPSGRGRSPRPRPAPSSRSRRRPCAGRRRCHGGADRARARPVRRRHRAARFAPPLTDAAGDRRRRRDGTRHLGRRTRHRAFGSRRSRRS